MIQKWVDNQGNNRRSAVVDVDHSYFAEKRQDRPEPQGAYQSYSASGGVDVSGPGWSDLQDVDGDLPF